MQLSGEGRSKLRQIKIETDKTAAVAVIIHCSIISINWIANTFFKCNTYNLYVRRSVETS